MPQALPNWVTTAQMAAACLKHADVIDQCGFGAETLARFIEPRFLAGRQGATMTLRQQVTHRMGQRGGLGKLLARSQHGRSFAETSGQALGGRAQAGLDRLDAHGQAAQPNAFCAADRNQERPAFDEMDVVVILSAVRLSVGIGGLVNWVDPIATRQAVDGAKSALRVKHRIAWRQHFIAA